MSRPIDFSFYRFRAGEPTRRDAPRQSAAPEHCQAYTRGRAAIGEAVATGDTRATDLIHDGVHVRS